MPLEPTTSHAPPTLDLVDPASRGARLGDFVKAGRAALRERHESGASGREVVRGFSRLLIAGITSLFQVIHREQGSPAGIALAAIGGFGRLEVAPRSDLDLLLLHDDLPEEVVRAVAEPLFTALWDAGLEVGSSVRTPAQCAEVAQEDHTVRTALLDCRFLAGDREIYGRFEGKVLRDLSSRQVDELVEAKVAELRARRERFGGSVHLLEPNIKQSPGGLRDLQASLWMARARFKAGGLSDLLALGVMPPREIERLKEARDFMWRTRNQLHFLAGKRQDHLTYHWQEEVARALGYVDRQPEGLAVEQFMRDYYLAASLLHRLADELADRCAPQREAPSAPTRWRVGPGLEVWNDRLTLESREALREDPSLFVRLFTTSEGLDLEILGHARDLVREEASRIDEGVRRDPGVAEALRAAFTTLGRGLWLRRMHREGVLGALLPEFGRVTAKHQHDVYHVYTVDTHSILAMQKPGRLRAGDLQDEQPRLSLLAREIARPLALSLGVLFHDAGKGMGGSHSERGAELVVQVCDRLGLGERERSDAEFLVRHHLRMSHDSQRRDLSDPGLIEDFASLVGDRERLDMLYVLTYVDISSVGPTTWTEWKGSLLAELHEKTAAFLEGRGLPSGLRSRQRDALLARGIAAERADAFLARLPRRYFSFADPRDAMRSMRILEMGARFPLVTAIRDHGGETSLILTADDRPGLLASIAGVMTAHRIDILRADVFSTTDGRALDVFLLRGSGGGVLERSRWRAARKDLLRVVTGEITAEELLRKKLRGGSGLPPKHLPQVETKVKLDNRSARSFTVVDVFAQDRRGLLHAVTAALRAAGLTISVARIATEGNRAIDSFYVTDEEGRKLADEARLPELERILLQAIQSVPLGD